jgi:V/A-type H+-transporting ATPase subunit F
MAKAVAVGEKHLVLGFKGVGMDVVPVAEPEALRAALMHLARNAEVGLVFVTESMAAQAPDVLRDFREAAQAILVVIPSHEGSKGFSFEEMRKSVERSIGVDILGKE